MKVLVACDEYCYRIGGKYYLREFGHTLLRRYLNVFEQVRFVVRTKDVAFDDLQAYRILVEDYRVEIFPIPFFQGPKQYWKHYFEVKESLRCVAEDCDLAILRLPSTTAFATWRQIKKRRLPCVTEVVFDCFDGCRSAGSMVEKLLWFVMHKWQQAICTQAIGVACVTEKYLQKHYYPKRKDAVLSSYSSIELPESFYFRCRKHAKKSIFRIIHIANQVAFNGRKGHNELIRALKYMSEKGYEVEVVFVGQDYQNGKERLVTFAKEQGVDDRLVFTGYLSQQQLREQMVLADIAVLPTKAEGLPRVVIEAMAMGLPCITTNVSGNPELISSDFLIDYADIHKLAEKVILLMENGQLYEEVSKRNFEESKKFSSVRLNSKRDEFYGRVKQKICEI